MPDWFTHTLIAWITGKTINQDIALVVIGTLIPDLVKLNLAFIWFGLSHYEFFEPLHTPISAILVAGIIALFFPDIKKTMLPLSIGILIHFVLDFFLVHAHSGMKLLFPLSWDGWQYNLYRSDDYLVTIYAVIVALLVYGINRYLQNQKTSSLK